MKQLPKYKIFCAKHMEARYGSSFLTVHLQNLYPKPMNYLFHPAKGEMNNSVESKVKV